MGLRLAPLLFACALGTGCLPVLTETQVGAVHDFAERSKQLPLLPPEVLETYGDARATREALHLAADTFGTPDAGGDGLKKLDETVRHREELDAELAKLRPALAVLQRYADLLEKLSSTALESDLDKPAEALGNSLDDAVAAYNGAKGSSLPNVGSGAGAVARAAGGLILRVRQAAYVKAYVEQADPIVQVLAREIQEALALYASAAGDDGHFARDLKALHSSFLVATLKAHLTFDESFGYYRAARAELQGRHLADHVIAAAAACAQAHSKLKTIVKEPLDLTSALEEAKIFSKELGAAAEVKTEIDQARR